MNATVDQYLQLIAWFLAIVEFVLTLYILLLNIRHTANRHAAALFLLITLHTFSIGLMLGGMQSSRVGVPLSAATMPAVIPAILLMTVMLIKPQWLPGRGRAKWTRVWWLVYGFWALPIILTAIDVIFGTRLWYTPVGAAYSGGYVPIGQAAAGVVSRLIRAPITYITGMIPIILLVYIIARDREITPLTRRLAWLLLAVQIASLVVGSTLHGPVSGPVGTLFLEALFTLTYAYAAFRQMISERRAQTGRVQTRLVVLLLALALPLLIGLVTVVISRAGDAITLKSNEQLATANRSVAANTTTWLDLNVAALNELVMLPQIASMDAAQQKPILEAMAAAHPQMYLVSTTDPQGINVARNDAEAPKDYSDRAWFKGAVSGAPVTLQTLIGRTGGQPALVVSVPIQRDPGMTVGVGMFASELTDVAQQVQLVTVGETGFSYLVDAENQVVAYPQAALAAAGGDLNSSVPITPLADMSDYPPVRALRAGTRGQTAFTDDAGQRWRAYVDEMEYGWGVVVQQPEEDFLSALRGLQWIAAAFLVIGMILLPGVMVLTVRQVLLPVGRLTETAAAIAGGDLLRTAPVESEDEFGVLARAFNRMTEELRELIGTLEQRVAERTRSLQAAAEVSRATTSLRDPDELLRQVVDLVQDRFNLYYVGLFLVDEARQWAVLRAGTGEAGQTMIAQGHRLSVAGESMIGRCVAGDQARIALDVGKEPVRFDNPLLPDTRSEMALPLHSRGQVVGAMTVQSAVEAAFDETDIAVLQTMADQVAVAIDNARLFVETQAALKELEAVHRQYLREAWTAYTPTAGATYYETAPLAGAEEPSDGNGKALVEPIALRGEEIGTLGIQDDSGTRQWTAEEVALVQAVTNRLALAAENLRLIDETQRRAAQERWLSQVADQMQRAASLDTLLRIAAEELRQELDATHALVQLGTEAELTD